MDLSLTSGVDNYETLKQFESCINRKQNGVFTGRFSICDKFLQISCTPRKLFHRKFFNFFWIFFVFLLLTFLWFFISILHSYVTTNICAKQCSNVLFTLLFFFKYHNQKLQFKYLSWKLITVWKYLQHTWLYDVRYIELSFRKLNW